ncbi:MAG: ribonuclease III [Rhodocyclaceae bacterium]|nr:ribonuclease III [Rhodocyclaceae bacterium]
MSGKRIEKALGYSFIRKELLTQALTHRSYGTPHNERIEFLGDSILNCAIATRLFQSFPQAKEGELSRMRASLVRQESLAALAQNLDLGHHLRLGEGELKSGGFRRPSILADALEAIFGAIAIDANFDAAADVIVRLYQPLIDAIDVRESTKDAKTALQEYLQGKHHDLPKYTLLSTRGEDHAQEFEVECAVPQLGLRAQGTGNSRRLAEQAAARTVLQQMEGK